MEAVSVSLYCLLWAVFTVEHEPLLLFKQNVPLLFVLIAQEANFIQIMPHVSLFISFCFHFFKGNSGVNT